jgi:Cu2+-exporting ATPase
MVGVGRGAENNMLIKDAESLELAHRVNAVVLDKTGTITRGRPTVSDIRWNVDDRDVRPLKGILLAIEQRSEHPLAAAVVERLKAEGVSPVEVMDFESYTGHGVQAVSQGTRYLVGNQLLMTEKGIARDETIESAASQWRDLAKTVVFFSDQERIVAVLAIEDEIKETSKEAIAALQGEGIEVHMLTGDNEQTAHAIARQTGLLHYKAQVLPGDKAQYVKQLQAAGKTVAMVGDGINDTQALAQADVSIAMGKGSDIAIDVAKVTLITSDLLAIPKVLRLSGKTVQTIRQNLFWAFIYNIIGIPLAAGILYPVNGFLLNPMIAGAAMALSSVSVVSNSLRLRFARL